jgi:hypothetical protein
MDAMNGPIEARGVKEAVWNGEPLSEAVGVGAITERENSPPSETHPTAGATASITRPRCTATAFEKCEPPSHAKSSPSPNVLSNRKLPVGSIASDAQVIERSKVQRHLCQH